MYIEQKYFWHFNKIHDYILCTLRKMVSQLEIQKNLFIVTFFYFAATRTGLAKQPRPHLRVTTILVSLFAILRLFWHFRGAFDNWGSWLLSEARGFPKRLLGVKENIRMLNQVRCLFLFHQYHFCSELQLGISSSLQTNFRRVIRFFLVLFSDFAVFFS